MSPTGAANGDSTPHSRRSTPQRRFLTADDRVALPELVVAPAQPKVVQPMRRLIWPSYGGPVTVYRIKRRAGCQ